MVPRRALRLEMAGRTVVLLLALLGLTGAVIFYLGVITGKGLRNPNAPPPSVATAPGAAPGAAAGNANSDPAPASPAGVDSVALNRALTATDNPIEGLKQEAAQASRQAQTAASKAKQELQLEEVSQPPPAPTKARKPESAPPPPSKAAARKPAAARPAANQPAASQAVANPPAAPKPPAAQAAPAAPGTAEGSYTVQVFSSLQQQSARDVMNGLKHKGYGAFLNQFQAADGKTWYRVRVGRASKAEAETLAQRLRKEGNLEGLRVLKL